MEISRVIWRKSSRSEGNGGNCVEIAHLDSTIVIRDSKNPTGPRLTFSPRAWRAFDHAVRAGFFHYHV